MTHHAQRLSLWLFIVSLAVGALDGAANERLQVARDFLEEHRTVTGEVVRDENFQAIHDRIAATPDPETKFGYVLFSIARHRQKLLTDEQAAKFDALIDARKQAEVNWHDVRNIVRVQAVIQLWHHAQAAGDTEELRGKWEAWTDLRLAFMFEEFVAKERFQRSAWGQLTSSQRGKVLSGEWDEHFKKSTGHGRLFSADKQIRRVLGSPDHPEEFDAAVEKCSQSWQPMHERYLASSRFERQREIAMDLADENFAIAAWDDYATAFRAFVVAEFEAVRDILQAGYDIDAEAQTLLDQHRTKTRSDMVEKFSPHAEEFLRALGEIK